MKMRAQPWLGTLVEIGLADELDDAVAAVAFERAFGAVGRVHRLMSFHDPDSDVSRLNRAAPGTGIEVDPMTWSVLDTALAVERETGGMFDIGCAPVLAARGYLPPPYPVPPEKVPASELLSLAGPGQVGKRRPGWVDLGGIAKGFAVDAAVEALLAAGVGAGVVNAGGDLRAFGPQPFTVAVRDPAHPLAGGTVLSLRDEALATSAGYFSRRRIDGEDHTALVDGRDARPLALDNSASVRAPSCMLADALTKAVLSSGDPRHPALATFGATAFLLS